MKLGIHHICDVNKQKIKYTKSLLKVNHTYVQ